MANLFKSKLDSLVKSMSSLIMGEDAKQKDEFTLQCEALDKQVEEFKAHEKELYADIGVVAIEKYGAEPFDELGQSFAQLQEQIKAAEAQKAELIRVHEEELRAAEEARRAEEERKAAEEAARLAEEARKAEEAARLAAYYSKGRQAPKVEIDYTLKKNLRKPGGAKPGFVVYYTNYSLMAEPDISGIRES